MKIFKNTFSGLVALLSLAIILPIPAGADVPKHLGGGSAVTQPILRSKAAEVLPAPVLDYLRNRDGETVDVWVFFTDKGVFSQKEFESRASEIRFTDKVKKRRKRAGVVTATFADLPVVRRYIDRITTDGSRLRRVSRWLNAASFEIPIEALERISRLPFVAEIKPLMRYRRDPVDVVPVEPDATKTTAPKSLAPPLEYGTSLDQLTQLNVPAMHVAGYTGAGVTIAILDTGYRKSHQSFSQHYTDGRVLDEYDFVFDDAETANEAEDLPNQWNHGTLIWSCIGGYDDGSHYGPAYKANFLLAKTEDVGSETPVEEDNWVAALEWADSHGADIVSSSLGYMVFDAPYGGYIFEDLDGATATTSIAASTAASLGIIVCKSAGNSGPGTGTISTPADAFDILSVGAVDASGYIASFSSRGPTYDGRIKPEVCARGVSTAAASAVDDYTYGYANGTSLSAPLVAGVVALIIEARPDLDSYQIMEAIKSTADNAATPDNTYGWGIVNAFAARGYGVAFEADVTDGEAPLDVQFTVTLPATADAWIWSFGDGDTSYVREPLHTFNSAGTFNISLAAVNGIDTITQNKVDYIIVLGDTLSLDSDSAYAGTQAVLSVELANYQELIGMDIVFGFETVPHVDVDSVTFGSRTDHFDVIYGDNSQPELNCYRYLLSAGTSEPLVVGRGEILRLYCTVDEYAYGDLSNELDTISFSGYSSELTSSLMTYQPTVVESGALSTLHIRRGDANNNGELNISDITYLVNYLFGVPLGPPPVAIQAGDANASLSTNVSDITYLVAHLFGIPTGPAPPIP